MSVGARGAGVPRANRVWRRRWWWRLNHNRRDGLGADCAESIADGADLDGRAFAEAELDANGVADRNARSQVDAESNTAGDGCGHHRVAEFNAHARFRRATECGSNGYRRASKQLEGLHPFNERLQRHCGRCRLHGPRTIFFYRAGSWIVHVYRYRRKRRYGANYDRCNDDGHYGPELAASCSALA